MHQYLPSFVALGIPNFYESRALVSDVFCRNVGNTFVGVSDACKRSNNAPFLWTKFIWGFFATIRRFLVGLGMSSRALSYDPLKMEGKRVVVLCKAIRAFVYLSFEKHPLGSGSFKKIFFHLLFNFYSQTEEGALRCSRRPSRLYQVWLRCSIFCDLNSLPRVRL